MIIYCCGCESKIKAKLTNGKEIYPHRTDLYSMSFYKCDICKNYVGCHKKNENKIPLGCIPTKPIMAIRQKIHNIIDPLWKSGKYKRSEIYKKISKIIGYQYHTAEIDSIEKAENILKVIKELKYE